MTFRIEAAIGDRHVIRSSVPLSGTLPAFAAPVTRNSNRHDYSRPPRLTFPLCAGYDAQARRQCTGALMSRQWSNPTHGCREFRATTAQRLARREFLRLGGVS